MRYAPVVTRSSPAAEILADPPPGHIWEVLSMTDAQKIRRILQALDDRARGLLDPQSLVDVLLAILAGRDPYAEWDAVA
jgi:hypothetical protein